MTSAASSTPTVTIAAGADTRSSVAASGSCLALRLVRVDTFCTVIGAERSLS